MGKIAIVEFEGRIYWGHPHSDSSNVWGFREINGLKHFRAMKNRGYWDNYENEHKAVFGVELEDKSNMLYRLMANVGQ